MQSGSRECSSNWYYIVGGVGGGGQGWRSVGYVAHSYLLWKVSEKYKSVCLWSVMLLFLLTNFMLGFWNAFWFLILVEFSFIVCVCMYVLAVPWQFKNGT